MSRVGSRTPASKADKQHSADPGSSGHNPFDSDSESEPDRASSAPPNSKAVPTGYEEGKGRGASSSSSSQYSGFSAAKSQYGNDFRDLGGFENQTVQVLENYAIYKAEETTEKINSCLKIAEDIREDATRTLVTLHQQGEQITRTHLTAANIEHDLSRGEKLLGSLGGMFSRTWKPKINRQIKGPVLMRDDAFKGKGSHLDQKERLGLSSCPKGQSNHRQLPSEPTSELQKVEVEKAKQDDALSDLSNLLGQLKDMALGMGSEIERQNTALEAMQDDVDELNKRVRGASLRGRRLLGK